MNEELLFKQWKEDVKEYYPIIIPDGIVCKEQWESFFLPQDYHILFVLKEVNGGSDWSLANYLYNGAGNKDFSATWSNIARWTYAIRNINNPINLKWENIKRSGNQAGRIKYLRTICAINIKKSPGGASTQNGALEAFCNYKDKKNRSIYQ